MVRTWNTANTHRVVGRPASSPPPPLFGTILRRRRRVSACGACGRAALKMGTGWWVVLVALRRVRCETKNRSPRLCGERVFAGKGLGRVESGRSLGVGFFFFCFFFPQNFFGLAAPPREQIVPRCTMDDHTQGESVTAILRYSAAVDTMIALSSLFQLPRNSHTSC